MTTTLMPLLPKGPVDVELQLVNNDGNAMNQVEIMNELKHVLYRKPVEDLITLFRTET
jgi:hypothetical protein